MKIFIAFVSVTIAVVTATLLLKSCELTNPDLPQTNGKGQDFGDKDHR